MARVNNISSIWGRGDSNGMIKGIDIESSHLFILLNF